jgi:hypothetical protein
LTAGHLSIAFAIRAVVPEFTHDDLRGNQRHQPSLTPSIARFRRMYSS